MSGLRKAKQYDWKDSNLALFGSDTEKQVKKESAECEPAWQGCGQKPGLQVWRIEKFQVKHVAAEDYGEFYDGDSYIILNTYKDPDSDALNYDVHFWIGKSSTQDEYGTAAYKTVELDTFLDDKPVQHREVMGYESSLFKSYFKTLKTLCGGVDSGFRRVVPDSYTPRLLHFSGKGKNVEVREIRMCKSAISNTDVYILDLGNEIHQYNGEESSGFERNKAANFARDLGDNRGGKKVEVTDNQVTFERMLPREDEEDDQQQLSDEISLHKLSDGGTSSFSFEQVKDGPATADDFDSSDVFVYDTGKMFFVWVGGDASRDEVRNSMAYAQKYAGSTDHPCAPITCVQEGQHCKDFQTAIAA